MGAVSGGVDGCGGALLARVAPRALAGSLRRVRAAFSLSGLFWGGPPLPRWGFPVRWSAGSVSQALRGTAQELGVVRSRVRFPGVPAVPGKVSPPRWFAAAPPARGGGWPLARSLASHPGDPTR